MASQKQDRKMSEELTRKFIEKYKEHSCLWDTKSLTYNRKNAKIIAYQELVQLLKPDFPNANIYFVSKKINTMRSIVRKEHNKVLASESDYVPMLWYYNLMKFIFTNNDKHEDDDNSETPHQITNDKVCEEKPSKCETNIANEVIYSEDVIFEDDQMNWFQDDIVLEQEFEAVATCIAAKMQKINSNDVNQRLICEKLINQALSKGFKKILTPNTKISAHATQYS